MSSQSLMRSGSSQHPYLEGISGGHRGQILELTSDRITIGRHENNDLVLSGEGVSRYHAVLENNGGVWVVSDSQSKNGILVNGVLVPQQVLNEGDSVQIGTYTFRFHTGHSSGGAVELHDDPAAEPVYPQAMAGMESPRPAAGPKSKRPLIYGGVALLLGYLYFTSQSPTTTPEKKEETGSPAVSGSKFAEAPEKRDFTPNSSKITGLDDPLLTRAEKDTQSLEFGNNSIREAEQYFKKGQREYLNKNYHRAIDDFRTALNLNRGHELADYYMRLSIFEVESEAKQHMEIGRKYFESMQYQRAIYHFNQVIALMQHRTSDKMSSDATKFIDQCQKRLQAAEQFP